MEPDNEKPPVAVTTEGQPNARGANGNRYIAHRGASGKPDGVAIPRAAFERLVQSAIDLLDNADGDADLELCSDETEHDGGEDCFSHAQCDVDGGPGCEVSDPGGCEHDRREPEVAL